MNTKRNRRLLLAVTTLTCALPAQDKTQDKTSDKAAAPVGVHGFEVKRMDGSSIKLSAFAGKTVLIVNTASQCGLTPQYEGLQKLQDTYEKKGFTVLAFPANDFGQQEPGTNEEIAKFCKDKYSVTFPVMAKVTVKGESKEPLYQYLTEASPFPGEVSWNFQKYLIDGKGTVVARFEPRVKPMDAKVTQAIEGALTGKAPAAGDSPAKAAVAAACKLAGETDKVVLVHFSADWCGWCKKYEAFAKRPEIEPILQASFVSVRVATDKMSDGQALYDSYAQGTSRGIPFMAWLDAKGAILDRGYLQDGELIGYPSSPAEIDAFMAIFTKHAKHAKPEQIAVVRSTLAALGEKPKDR